MIQIISHQYGIEGVGLSMQGGRTENQDDMGCRETPLGFLVVVCDGMGGGPGGKTASYISKSTVFGVFEQCSESASPYDVIKIAIDNANTAIAERTKIMPELDGMGSTIVLLLINEKSAFVAHLGDSRCYQIRNEKVVFRTKDHSLVGELVASGAMTEEEARTSSQSNIITRGIGSTTNHVAEIVEIPYRHGDRFVLCTDGVWGIMPYEDLKLRLTSKQDVGSLVRNLSTEIDQMGASQGNHHDNHTIAILEMKNNSILNMRMDKKLKSIIYIVLTLLAISVVFNVVSFLHFGINPQMQTLKISNDSLLNATAQLSEVLEDKNSEIDRLLEQNKELENTIRIGHDEGLQERARLLHNMDSLGIKIDSLKKAIKQLQDKEKEAISKPKVVAKQDRESRRAVNPVAQLDNCISKLRVVKELNTTDQKTATRTVKDSITDCKKQLDQFKASTSEKNKKIITSILEQLKSDNFNESKNVVSKRNVDGRLCYGVREETKTDIEDIVGKLNNLKKSITKR